MKHDADAPGAQMDPCRPDGGPSSDDLLTALLEVIPDFVYFKDRERRFVRVSRPFEALLGRPISEILGRRDEELFPPDVAAATVLDDEAVLAGDAIVDRIEGGELPTGERWVSTTKVPWRDADGRIIGLMGISRDITASKRRVDAMQRAFQRALRLETLGRLAGGVAHDFNNLLMIILGSAEELAEGLSRQQPAHGLAEMVIDAARQARGLTRQLLRFSRREPGPTQSVYVDRVLVDLHTMLVRLMPDDIDVHLACSPAEPVSIDPVRLQQAVFNLALNARDAMPGGGRLTLSTAPAIEQGRSGVTLVVRDTGEGLDPAIRGSMFEPFSSTKPEGLGTGLGLSVVGAIVDEMQGRIRVESAPGEGTAFHLWFPVAEAASPDHPRQPPHDAARANAVLLIDDDDGVRRSIARMLVRMGHAVHEAGDITEAVEAAGEQRFDLVITDVILREGTGVDVVEALRLLQPGVPVLYVSGFTDDVFSRRGIRPRELELLLKPFTHRELHARIERVLKRAKTAERP